MHRELHAVAILYTLLLLIILHNLLILFLLVHQRIFLYHQLDHLYITCWHLVGVEVVNIHCIQILNVTKGLVVRGRRGRRGDRAIRPLGVMLHARNL